MKLISICVALALSSCSVLLRGVSSLTRRVPLRQASIMWTGEDRLKVFLITEAIIGKEPLLASVTSDDLQDNREAWPQASREIENRLKFMKFAIESTKFLGFRESWRRIGVEEAVKIGIPKRDINMQLIPYMKSIEGDALSEQLMTDIFHTVSLHYDREYLSRLFHHFSLVWKNTLDQDKAAFKASLVIEFRDDFLPQAAAAYIIEYAMKEITLFKEPKYFVVLGDLLDSFNEELESKVVSFSDIESRFVEKLEAEFGSETTKVLVAVICSASKLVEELRFTDHCYNTEIE